MSETKIRENEMGICFSVVNNDAVDVPSDILVLKHTGGFSGVDMVVAKLLVTAGICKMEQLTVKPGDFVVLETRSAIYPKKVLVIGTEPADKTGYKEMGRFSELIIKIVANQNINVRKLTTTIQGSAKGLNSVDSLRHLVNGFKTGVRKHAPASLEEIVFVELDTKRAEKLTKALQEINQKITKDFVFDPHLFDNLVDTDTENQMTDEQPVFSTARHVFVAMPFSKDFKDAYHGILRAVVNLGFECERTDESAFTGDILHRIKDKIETADFVVADLTGARPNVYLEVGYAWGKGRPVLFVAREGETLQFDVSRHKCIYYDSGVHLEEELSKLLSRLLHMK